MKIIKVIILLLIIVAIVLIGRNFFNQRMEDDKDIRAKAQDAVSVINQLYNQGDAEAIYEICTDNFKNATSRKDFLLVIRRKKEVLGDFRSSHLLFSNVINHKMVVLRFRSVYKNYSLIEDYELSLGQNKALYLDAYFIDDAGKFGEVIKL